ncbi:glycine betaine ABC transporter substrate-binding protein [Tsukamurella sp. PLM1]|uniref:taurine ABC transporter substrate-binding protein n=1 Tax=Tsukamurella sp. PLM1 TaxID=2929795 RepID=UPI0020597D0B|nr:glycine betaine ABC transporter substrate-binding protein [Tsukamurella sp. PLM1]BDH56140.1 glycine/betaine ABC transporter substrate-binding protein [Tsukamurella sp. PLM1]
MNRARLALKAAALVTVGLTLSGCIVESGRAEQSRSIGGSTPCPVEPDPTVRGTVRIGWQEIPNGDLVVKDTGLLGTCLPNVNVVWSKFASGGDVIQAFGANSLDVGLLGSAPAAKALSAPLNIDMKVIWIQDRIGAAESLVAKDPSIKTVADLKDKRIAVPFASTAHYSLLTALAKAGVTDAQVINLAPDAIRGAWGGGQIDATYIWEPTLSQLKGTVLTDSAQVAEQGAPTYDLEGARADFVRDNPAFLRVWTAVQGWAANLINTDPNKAAEHIAGQLGVPLEQILTQIKGYAYFDAKTQAGPEYLGGQLGADIRRTAEFLLQQGQVQGVGPAQHYTDGVFSAGTPGGTK